MKLKTIELNGATYAEVQDGKPVYEADDGKAVAFDVPHAMTSIKRLNDENKAQRQAREAAEAKLQGFAGIDDPEHARKALETLRNLDDKKLIDAGEVEKVKREAYEAYMQKFEAQYKPLEAELNKTRSQLHNEKLGTAFERSQYLPEKTIMTADLAQARFGGHFVIGDDGKIHTKGPDGSPIFSRAKPGEEAGFEEALEILVDAHPLREKLLKGSGASGGGAGGSRSFGGKRTITRAQFDSMNPVEKATVARAADVSIVD